MEDYNYVKRLLDDGLDPNSKLIVEIPGGKFKNKDGNTLLMSAINVENIDIVKLLINLGADINLTGNYGYSPLSKAIDVWNIGIIDYLLDIPGLKINILYGSSKPSTILSHVCMLGRCDIFDKLISKGADVNFAPDGIDSCLMEATINNRIDIIDRLLQQGCNVNYASKNMMTPIHNACILGEISIIDRLISFGADFRVKNMQGSTPFFIASFESKMDAMKRLIEIGCDVNEPCDSGLTPLEYQVKFQRYDQVKFLLENGAIVNFDIDNIRFYEFYPRRLDGEKIKTLLRSYQK